MQVCGNLVAVPRTSRRGICSLKALLAADDAFHGLGGARSDSQRAVPSAEVCLTVTRGRLAGATTAVRGALEASWTCPALSHVR